MTSPTREEIQTAHEALETLTDTCIHSADQAEELQELVLRALPPKPLPTMAEVEWDDDVHYLAEAALGDGAKVIMLVERNDFISCIQPPNAGDIPIGIPKEDLTPTGKRYTLTEVQE